MELTSLGVSLDRLFQCGKASDSDAALTGKYFATLTRTTISLRKGPVCFARKFEIFGTSSLAPVVGPGIRGYLTMRRSTFIHIVRTAMQPIYFATACVIHNCQSLAQVVSRSQTSRRQQISKRRDYCTRAVKCTELVTELEMKKIQFTICLKGGQIHACTGSTVKSMMVFKRDGEFSILGLSTNRLSSEENTLSAWTYGTYSSIPHPYMVG